MTYSRFRLKRRLVFQFWVFVLFLIVFMVGFLCGKSSAGTTNSQTDALEVEPPPFIIEIHSEQEQPNTPNALKTLEVETAEAPTAEPERETFNLYEHIAMEMTSEEFRLLGLILAMEAQDEPYDGQKAVVEVIFNRVLSPDFPDTVYGVLSEKGQFSTWGFRNKPYNVPGESEKKAIDEVIANGNQNTVLPEGYVFFSRGKVNGTGFIKIGNHQFSKAKVKK